MLNFKDVTTACFCQINKEHKAKKLNTRTHKSVNFSQIFIDLNSKNFILPKRKEIRAKLLKSSRKQTDRQTGRQTDRQEENIPLNNIIVRENYLTS